MNFVLYPNLIYLKTHSKTQIKYVELRKMLRTKKKTLKKLEPIESILKEGSLEA